MRRARHTDCSLNLTLRLKRLAAEILQRDCRDDDEDGNGGQRHSGSVIDSSVLHFQNNSRGFSATPGAMAICPTFQWDIARAAADARNMIPMPVRTQPPDASTPQSSTRKSVIRGRMTAATRYLRAKRAVSFNRILDKVAPKEPPGTGFA